jgi:phosphatidylserine decarboxylase
MSVNPISDNLKFVFFQAETHMPYASYTRYLSSNFFLTLKLPTTFRSTVSPEAVYLPWVTPWISSAPQVKGRKSTLK